MPNLYQAHGGQKGVKMSIIEKSIYKELALCTRPETATDLAFTICPAPQTQSKTDLRINKIINLAACGLITNCNDLYHAKEKTCLYCE